MKNDRHPADETNRNLLTHGIVPAALAAVLLAISAYYDLVAPGDHWTQRVGSIVTVLGAYVAYVNGKRSWKLIDDTVFINHELPYRWISVLLIVIGTVTWGYADLIL